MNNMDFSSYLNRKDDAFYEGYLDLIEQAKKDPEVRKELNDGRVWVELSRKMFDENGSYTLNSDKYSGGLGGGPTLSSMAQFLMFNGLVEEALTVLDESLKHPEKDHLLGHNIAFMNLSIKYANKEQAEKIQELKKSFDVRGRNFI